MSGFDFRNLVPNVPVCLPRSKQRNLEERFWLRVNMLGDCWVWIGGIYLSGYGQFYVAKGKHTSAHRVSWQLACGPIPQGLSVLHRCDIKCPPGDTAYRRRVRPDHLFLGTTADNMADMAAKRRQAYGERHGMRLYPHRAARGSRAGNTKLTEQDVLRIRAIHAAGGYMLKEIGAIFGVSESVVWHIVHRASWRHV